MDKAKYDKLCVDFGLSTTISMEDLQFKLDILTDEITDLHGVIEYKLGRLRDVANRFDVLNMSERTIHKILLTKAMNIQQISINRVKAIIDEKYHEHSNISRVIRAKKLLGGIEKLNKDVNIGCSQ